MSGQTETESKYLIVFESMDRAVNGVISLVTAIVGHDLVWGTAVQTDMYYDTDDLNILAGRSGLRIRRKADGAMFCALKTGGGRDGRFKRTEDEVVVISDDIIEAVSALSDGSRNAIDKITSGRCLRNVLTVTNERTKANVTFRGCSIEFVADRVDYGDERELQVEIEFISGNIDGYDEFVRMFEMSVAEKEFSVIPMDESKYERGMRINAPRGRLSSFP